MNIVESYSSQIAAQAASLSILPVWYPFFAKSVYLRSGILESKFPGVPYSNFFAIKRNYFCFFTGNVCMMQPLFFITDLFLATLLNKVKQVNQRDPNVGERLSIGFITGAATASFANPYETMLIASQKYREGPFSVFKRILQHEGVAGFYTGTVPMAIRNGTFVSTLFVATPLLQKKIVQHVPGSGKTYEIATMVLASIIPASIYTCVAAPLDLMAIMRQSDPSGRVHSSAFGAIEAAYKKHGKAAFRAGLGSRLIACIVEMAGFTLLKNFYLDRLKNETAA